jgi:dihydrofolate reductase
MHSSPRLRRGLALFDEYHLAIHPIVLGAGLPLFPDLEHPLDFNVVDTERFDSGITRTVLRPNESSARAPQPHAASYRSSGRSSTF